VNILGIGFLSDASAAVVRDGRLVAAVAEERLNRVKLWHGIPRQAIATVLELAGLALDDIDLIATHGAAPVEPDPRPYADKEAAIRAAGLPPALECAQLEHLHARLQHERHVLSVRTPGYLAELRGLGRPLRVFGHHESHAATAYYGSGWDDCLVLTADGWGEDGSSTLWRGTRGKMVPVARSHSFDSLGYFYGSVTKALGFVPHRHEGKVLGLAAYCPAPVSYPLLRAMIDYDRREKRFVGRMEGGVYRPRFENPTLRAAIEGFSREDVAAAAQQSLEDVVCACVADHDERPLRLAVAGGIFANVKLNQRLRELDGVEGMYVFPNMGDGGLAVGAAWLAHVGETGQTPEPLGSLMLGPASTPRDVDAALSGSGLHVTRAGDIEERIGALLADGHVVAHVADRMEFGPRALGNRSVLCPATDPRVNDWLNRRFRRSEFMPFAPATLAEHAEACFVGLRGGCIAARYMAMTFTCTTRMRDEAPAAVHVDGTARPQVVDAREAPRFHRILSAYARRTGRASVINTSFNMHEEPIVGTAADAVRAFRASGLRFLALGDCLVEAPEGTEEIA
jgi:carbamoyltransferase